eukprot:TsM_000401100 transcript=TsM_000401100 gene=TsM_000401100
MDANATIVAMEGLVSVRLVRSFGVSKFNERQLKRILTTCTVVLAANQIDVNIHYLNPKLINCRLPRSIVVEDCCLFVVLFTLSGLTSVKTFNSIVG